MNSSIIISFKYVEISAVIQNKWIFFHQNLLSTYNFSFSSLFSSLYKDIFNFLFKFEASRWYILYDTFERKNKCFVAIFLCCKNENKIWKTFFNFTYREKQRCRHLVLSWNHHQFGIYFKNLFPMYWNEEIPLTEGKKCQFARIYCQICDRTYEVCATLVR